MRTAVPGITPASAAIVARCLAKDRAQRFQDPAELCAALATALATLPAEPAVAAIPVGVAEDESPAGARSDTRATRIAGEPAHLLPTLAPTPAPTRAEPATTALERAGRMQATCAASADTVITPTARMVATAPAPATNGAASAPVAPTADSSTVALPVPDALVGDIALGFGEDWLCLVPEARGESTLVFLYARPRLVLGKFKDPSVDICLRNYPVATHLAACQRLSRSHLALAMDRAQASATVQDLGSSNGTTVDGERAAPNTPVALATDREHIVDLAKVVVLRIRAIAPRDQRRECVAGHRMQSGRRACGLDAAHPVDAVVITRPRNRPELAYAQVLRRLTVGGPGADLACAGANTPARCAFGLVAGRWIWRPDRHGEAWRPLTAESVLDCGGITLRPRAATLADF